MPRPTIDALRKEFQARDQESAREIERLQQEIGHLKTLLDEAHRKNYERAQTMKLVRTLIEIEDAQK